MTALNLHNNYKPEHCFTLIAALGFNAEGLNDKVGFDVFEFVA